MSLSANGPAHPGPRLEIERVANHPEYLERRARRAAERSRRLAIERELIGPGPRFTVSGWCWVCGAPRAFEAGWEYAYEVEDFLVPNWREHLLCPGCGLNNRMRATVQILEQMLAPGPADAIYLTEQTTPLYRVVHERHPGTIGSEWLGARVARGELDGSGLRNEDVTRLTFPSGHFACIVCLDVLEHVPGIGMRSPNCCAA